jgi:hypothetical protein
MSGAESVGVMVIAAWAEATNSSEKRTGKDRGEFIG